MLKPIQFESLRQSLASVGRISQTSNHSFRDSKVPTTGGGLLKTEMKFEYHIPIHEEETLNTSLSTLSTPANLFSCIDNTVCEREFEIAPKKIRK